MTQLETTAALSVPAIVPTLAMVISILRSNAKVDALSTRVDAKIDALRSDLRGDMRVLESVAYDHHGRISKVETKLQSDLKRSPPCKPNIACIRLQSRTESQP